MIDPRRLRNLLRVLREEGATKFRFEDERTVVELELGSQPVFDIESREDSELTTEEQEKIDEMWSSAP